MSATCFPSAEESKREQANKPRQQQERRSWLRRPHRNNVSNVDGESRDLTVGAAVRSRSESITAAAKIQRVQARSEVLNHQPITGRFRREKVSANRHTQGSNQAAGLYRSRGKQPCDFEIRAWVGHRYPVNRREQAGRVYGIQPSRNEAIGGVLAIGERGGGWIYFGWLGIKKVDQGEPPGT